MSPEWEQLKPILSDHPTPLQECQQEVLSNQHTAFGLLTNGSPHALVGKTQTNETKPSQSGWGFKVHIFFKRT